jgi:F-type H+-transporting ATPase subunit b
MTLSPVLMASVIDIDATVFVQWGMFLLLFLVLRSLLWKPFLELIERRDHQINGLRKEAAEAEENARRQEASYLEEYRAVQNRATERRAELMNEAQKASIGVLDTARAEAQSTVDSARKQIEAQTQEARSRAAADASSVAVAVCERILGRKVTS